MIEPGLAGAETIVLLAVAGNLDDHRIRESFLAKTVRELIDGIGALGGDYAANLADVIPRRFVPEDPCGGCE